MLLKTFERNFKTKAIWDHEQAHRITSKIGYKNSKKIIFSVVHLTNTGEIHGRASI